MRGHKFEVWFSIQWTENERLKTPAKGFQTFVSATDADAAIEKVRTREMRHKHPEFDENGEEIGYILPHRIVFHSVAVAGVYDIH